MLELIGGVMFVFGCLEVSRDGYARLIGTRVWVRVSGGGNVCCLAVGWGSVAFMMRNTELQVQSWLCIEVSMAFKLVIHECF